MHIIINNSSMEPIYEQIIGQIKAKIVDGSLKEGAVLPSVRGLSGELRISALTVKKAYDALEQQGFIVTVHGKGSFVAGNNRNLLQEEQRKKVEEKMEEAVRMGYTCGMSNDELRDILGLLLEE